MYHDHPGTLTQASERKHLRKRSEGLQNDLGWCWTFPGKTAGGQHGAFIHSPFGYGGVRWIGHSVPLHPPPSLNCGLVFGVP